MFVNFIIDNATECKCQGIHYTPTHCFIEINNTNYQACVRHQIDLNSYYEDIFISGSISLSVNY